MMTHSYSIVNWHRPKFLYRLWPGHGDKIADLNKAEGIGAIEYDLLGLHVEGHLALLFHAPPLVLCDGPCHLPHLNNAEPVVVRQLCVLLQLHQQVTLNVHLTHLQKAGAWHQGDHKLGVTVRSSGHHYHRTVLVQLLTSLEDWLWHFCTRQKTKDITGPYSQRQSKKLKPGGVLKSARQIYSKYQIQNLIPNIKLNNQ